MHPRTAKYLPKPDSSASTSSSSLSPIEALLTPIFALPAALPFFPQGIASPAAQQICAIVENTSFSKEKKLRAAGLWSTEGGGWRDSCTELKCVQDADRLDALGGMGIMRCSAYSAAVGRALYVPSGEDGAEESSIQHYHDKLFRLKEGMKVSSSVISLGLSPVSVLVRERADRDMSFFGRLPSESSLPSSGTTW